MSEAGQNQVIQQKKPKKTTQDLKHIRITEKEKDQDLATAQ